MEDQATSLRRLVEGKTEYSAGQQYPGQPANGWTAPGYAARPAAPSYQAKPVVQKLSQGGARTIAITSGKGGVGKTNFTVNLAIAMGMEGKRVLVIDADLGMANVDVLLGTASKYNLVNLLQPGISMSDVVLQSPHGINYISGGSALERALDFSNEERAVLMQKLSECERWADVILIDTGAGLGKNVMDFILAADEVLLLTTPEPTSLTDAYAVMKAYSLYASEKRMRLIVNRVFDEAESREVTRKLRRTSERFLQMHLDCLGYIYEDRNVVRAVRSQKPFAVSYPDTVAARCVQAIARNLLYGDRQSVGYGWRGFLQKLFNFSR